MKDLIRVLTISALLAAGGSALAEPAPRTPNDCGVPGHACNPPPEPLAFPTSFFGAKLAVTDFKRATDFYVGLLGLQEGPRYNDHEQGLLFDGGGPLIVLWLDTCGTAASAPRPPTSPGKVAAMLASCDRRFRAGAGWVVVRVSDVRRTAAALTAAGYDAPTHEYAAPGRPHATLALTQDPDGNIVEITGR